MIVLDTNVLSEAMKTAPAPAAASWMVRQNAGELFTTTVSEAEILLGIAILPDGRRKHTLDGQQPGASLACFRAGSDLRQRRRPSLCQDRGGAPEDGAANR